MSKEIIEIYRLSLEREAKLWEEAIFVFDSCALLDLYYIPISTRTEIYDNIFKNLPNRLWIPFHVKYEYLKNRQKVITKPISEKYNPLKKDIREAIDLIKKETKNKIENIENTTKNNNSHPYLEQQHILDFKEKFEDFVTHVDFFENTSNKLIEEKIEEIGSIEENDDVLSIIEDIFSVGREYTFSEIIEITKEGKHRYEFQIPPGYGDSVSKNSKKGTQIFGDLIIWKQILEYSKEKQKPIIFVTNDITKNEDWCYLDKKESNRIDRPREELIKEIKDNSGIEFWMYSLPQLLYKANEYLQSDIQENIIENVSQQMLSGISGQSLAKKVLRSIEFFGDLYPLKAHSTEDELVSSLSKYIEVLNPTVEILLESEGKFGYVDLVVKEGNETVLIEVTLAKASSLLNKKTNKLIESLIFSDVQNGILYAPYYSNPNSFKFGSISKVVNGKHYQVSQAFAK